MMGKTHKFAGCFAMLVAFNIMEQKGLLLNGVSPLLQLAVMYPACSWASTAPDVDQGIEQIPEKTPISILLHKIVHIGKVRHRSWKTHSPFVWLVTCGVLWGLLYYLKLGMTDFIISRLLLTGLTVGWASHLISDAFTYQGIPLFGDKHLRLVPKKDAFKTNTTYETVVRRILGVLIFILVIYMIIKHIELPGVTL